MEAVGLFDMFDQLIADELGVDVETYIRVIDEFNDSDMEYIIETVLNPNSTTDERVKAVELFNTMLSTV